MESQFLAESNINEFVKLYSKRILKDPKFYEEDEGYKYKAVFVFQKKFDLEADDLAAMLEDALPKPKDKTANLIQSGQYFPKGMLIKFAREDADFVRRILKELLNSHDSVSERIDNFIKEIHNKFPLKGEQYYIDARFLSFFLSANCPEQFFYVKPKEYKKFAQMIGFGLKIRGSQGEKYQIMHEFAEITREILKNNEDFKKVHKIVVENFDYKDLSMHWGTFDFIFDVARRESGELESAKKRIAWQTKVVNVKKESSEEFLLEEEVVDEVNKKTKAEILQEANDYRQKSSDNYKQKSGSFKVRRDNAIQKTKIKELEDYICQVCGFTFEFRNSEGKKRKYAEADHIIEKSIGGTEESHNLWVLCSNCHMKKTLGVINIDPVKKIVTENNNIIKIKDNHLGWNK